MIVPALIALAVLFGTVSALVTATDAALAMFPPGRLFRLTESRARGAEALDALDEISHRLHSTAVLGWALACGIAAVAVVAFLADLYSFTQISGMVFWGVSILWALGSTLVMFVLFQALPRAFAVANSEYIALSTASFSLAVTRVLGPIASGLSAPARLVITAAGGERRNPVWAAGPIDREESTEDSERENAEEAFLEAVSDFGEKIAREIMTPRTDMQALEDTDTVFDAVTLMLETGFSRVPVYSETVDDITGIVYVKDVLRAIAWVDPNIDPAKLPPLTSIMRPVIFVPETKPVRELLVEMRNQAHLAIVADEYGGTSGLITLEDLLEEIVGDISDEFDTETPLIEELPDGRFRIDARLSVDELNDLFGTALEIDADSVGGLFTEFAGHIPEVGESLTVEGIELTVTQLEGNRVRELIAVAATEDDAEDACGNNGGES